MAKAIEEAVKAKETKNEIKIEEKKPVRLNDVSRSGGETVSLQELRHGEKNKNKEPSPEHINALKEALEKAKNLEIKSEVKEKKDEKKKEVPEEVLRKILKGE